MGQIDLNLIRTFVTLYDSGSVTVAAERLFVTQPSVSYALARLRELFDDPLFVRNRDGMQPTSVARTLYATFKDALSRIEGTVEGIREFDPHKTARCFRIALSDLGEMALLPLILHRLNRLAPQAELEVVPLEIDQVNEWLSIGKVDAAICSRPLSSTGIVRQALISYYSLASGFLTGKYRTKDDIKGARSDSVKKYMTERGVTILSALDEVAEEYDATPARVALAWLMARPSVTAPIASATSLDQLKELAEATRLQLSAEDISTLDHASAY